ncbi:hypothetical protein MRX96_045830 [Rhipicephalus microplus]
MRCLSVQRCQLGTAQRNADPIVRDDYTEGAGPVGDQPEGHQLFGRQAETVSARDGVAQIRRYNEVLVASACLPQGGRGLYLLKLPETAEDFQLTLINQSHNGVVCCREVLQSDWRHGRLSRAEPIQG